MPVAKRLPHRLGIILPSRDGRGGELNLTLVRRIKAAVDDWFGEAFGGSTEDRVHVGCSDAAGGWEGEAMSVRELQARMNRRLREINRGYAVKNLRRLPNGEYWFDLAMAFSGRDMARVNRLFAEVLGPARHRGRETVQAKFYLSQATYERLRREAAQRGVKQSALVEEALESALSG